MRRSLLTLAALLALAMPASALAGTLTLHPSGFGEKSYAAWKAKQGLPDTKGNDDQALYFQKMTTTPTVAAGVAVIKGIAGTPLDELTGLAWDHREDGHCGAGAPRWNLTVRPTAGGSNQTFFLGCNAAVHTEQAVYNGHGWCRDTQPNPSGVVTNPSAFTVTGLAIVFDEGNDTPNPPPAGCEQEQFVGGFVHLDNITVEVNGVVHCWSGANDNGSGGAGACPSPPQSSTGLSPGLDFGLPLGIALDPADTALATALNLAFPEAPLLGWSLYPNVVY
jgi:hypothetical protein